MASTDSIGPSSSNPMNFGTRPQEVSVMSLEWDEYMHFMYLPVAMVGERGLRLPPNLEFARSLVNVVMALESQDEERPSQNVYVTARRGFATPGRPLNRPGWHTDGFGSDDINYIWSDRFPTLFAEQSFRDISPDHARSMEQFQEQLRVERVRTYPERMVLRLDQTVVHCVPEIPAPGGERGFVKVSVSPNRYDLRGNSHNHLFEYNWKMAHRSLERNDPVSGETP